jgi:hypothetical protein
MSSVSFYSLNEHFVNRCLYESTLKKSLTNNEQITKESIYSVFNNNGKQNMNKLFNDENKLVGNNDWHVLYNDSSRITKLENEMKGLKNEVVGLNTQVVGLNTQVDGLNTQVVGLTNEVQILKNIIVDEMIENIIRNTASNIILFFLGEQPNPNNPSKRFTDPENKKKLKSFIKRHDMVFDAKKLGNKLDSIITNRNRCVHPCGMETLVVDVEKCQKYISMFPEINEKFEFEVFTIHHYNEFTANV